MAEAVHDMWSHVTVEGSERITEVRMCHMKPRSSIVNHL